MLSKLTTNKRSENRYSITRLHAEGGLGRVWVASDTDVNREVVLKEIRPQKADDAQTVKRFVHEAQVTGQLEHPNIVPVYELGWRPQTGLPYYTMRFIRGKTLRDMIRSYQAHRANNTQSPLELRNLLQSFIAICNAIGYAHSRGVVHRDLKPANVAVGEFGEVIVLDWGLAKIVGNNEDPSSSLDLSGEQSLEHTMTGQVLGTLAYMPPSKRPARSA